VSKFNLHFIEWYKGGCNSDITPLFDEFLSDKMTPTVSLKKQSCFVLNRCHTESLDAPPNSILKSEDGPLALSKYLLQFATRSNATVAGCDLQRSQVESLVKKSHLIRKLKVKRVHSFGQFVAQGHYPIDR